MPEENQLSHTARTLLNQLITDYKEQGKAQENKEDHAVLIYNLFKGDYNFSYKVWEELYTYLSKKT